MQLTDNLHRHHTTTSRSPASDAFNTPENWLTSPLHAYSSWIGRQRYRNSSKTVLISMFGKLTDWMEYNNIRLCELEAENLRAFLDHSGMRKAHRHRYVRLVERVYRHLAAIGLPIIKNPGTHSGYDRVGAGNNDPTRFFSASERSQIAQYVLHACTEAGKDVIRKDQEDQWRRVRDCALAAVMLGGGVKVGQARRLTVNCMELPDGWIWLKGLKGHPHRARLAPGARDTLVLWLKVRAGAGIPGDWLFPSARSGRSRVLGLPMHQTSIYRRTQSIIESAGIRIDPTHAGAHAPRLCAQTLRNSYAATLIDEGAQDATLAEYLGFNMLVSARRMRAAYASWKNTQCTGTP